MKRNYSQMGLKCRDWDLVFLKCKIPKKRLKQLRMLLKTGYRAVDTAAVYENEKETGEAIRLAGVPREDLFITSKVWNTDQGYDETLRAFEASLERLELDYLDLYLTHWPVKDSFVDTYKAIERLYDEKLIRSTGVSNHHIHHLEKVFAKANIRPMVNQVEVHPRLTQEPLRQFCAENNIAVTSWSPLARGGELLSNPFLESIGSKYGKTSAQVIIRWHLQSDLIVIPKSVTPKRIDENIDVADFKLTNEEMETIDGLNLNERTGSNPEDF